MNNSGVNKAFLVGHLHTEPRWETAPNGDRCLTFILATHETFGRDKATFHTEYHSIKVPENLCKVDRSALAVGQVLHITGKVQTHHFTDRSNVRRYHTDIMANHVLPLSIDTSQVTEMAQ